MLRLLIREAALLAFLTVVISIVGFSIFDLTGLHDWAGVVPGAERAGIDRNRALLRDLPLLYNNHVEDVTVRTRRDLDTIHRTIGAEKERAIASIVARGSASLPSVIEEMQSTQPGRREDCLLVLTRLAPLCDASPPVDTSTTYEYWINFHRLRGLDFRQTYARRLVQRLVDRGSPNARQQLRHLGTYALPAIFEKLVQPIDDQAARTLIDLVSELTSKPMRIPPNATVTQIQETVNAWRAWWFVEHLTFERLESDDRYFARFQETRYGRWVERVFYGRLGDSKVTQTPLLRELRVRLPTSTFPAALAGLLGTVCVVTFGGGKLLRQRPAGVKVLDFFGSIIPGMGALTLGFLGLLQLCAGSRSVSELSREVFQDWPRIVLCVVLLTVPCVFLLQRASMQTVMSGVRREAELWALESRHPKAWQLVKHGARVGLASLTVPLGFAAPFVLPMTLVAELLSGLRGMGTLTTRSLLVWDAPWILLAIVTTIPLLIAVRWARGTLMNTLLSTDEKDKEKKTNGSTQAVPKKASQETNQAIEKSPSNPDNTQTPDNSTDSETPTRLPAPEPIQETEKPH